jgi:pimeloyl-ACP methyl ester carboxylesterase
MSGHLACRSHPTDDGIGLAHDLFDPDGLIGEVAQCRERAALDAPGGRLVLCRGPARRRAQLVWATHFAPAADLFATRFEGTAWRTKPSWCVVADNDRTIQPELERFAAKRMNATIYEVDGSHVPMLSNAAVVLDVVRTAAREV